MNREQKAAVISSLKDSFAQSKASFVVKYPGLTVKQMQNLRNDLRAKGAKLKVTKARLMKLAADGDPGAEVMRPYYTNQIGLVFAFEEPAAVAKVLSDFAKDNKAMSVIAGSLDQMLLDQSDISRIGSLPSKEVLLAQLCGTLNAPIAGFARALNMVPQSLLWALTQIGQKKQ